MYKGNMMEYIRNLDKFLRYEGCGSIMGPYISLVNNDQCVFYFRQNSAVSNDALTVEDQENFEEMVMEFLRNTLKRYNYI